MEYNINGMAPQQPNIFKRAWQSITLPHYGRTIGFLTLLVITLSVPATIAFLNQRTNLQQKAAGGVNGILQFSSDAAGNNIITTTNSPELYLKVTRPEGWEITTQGSIQKSSPVAYSPIKNIVQKVYAATFCTSPAVCSTGADPNNWTQTGETCMLSTDEGEISGFCYLPKNGGGSGSTPTATPTQAAGGSLTCAQGNCNACTTQTNSCGQHSYDTCDYSTCNNGGTTYRCYASQNPNGCSFSQYSCSLCSTPTPTQAAAGGGSGISPANGAQITSNKVTLEWPSIAGTTHYNVRVNNPANQNAKAINVSRGPGCDNPGSPNLFVCTDTEARNWLQDIPLSNNGTYTWWVDVNGSTIAQGSFTVSGLSGAPGQGVTTLTQIHIQNTDGGSGGHEAIRITGKTALTSFFSDPYWKLNTTANNTTRTVQVVFYGTDAQGNSIQRTTEQSITYTGTTPPTPIPTRTPFGCEKKPSEMGNDLSDNLYRWVQVNRADSGGQPLSSCQDDHLNSSVCVVLPGTTNAEKNAQCPQNTTSSFVEASTSNWCRNTPGGDATVAHCWQLQYIGSPAGPGASPTAPPPVPTAPTGQPTPTPMPGCTYTQTTCSGTSDAAANKVCSDANINSNWCYGGRCVTCAAALPTATTAPGSPTATTAPNEPTPIPTATPSITPPPPGPASVNFKVILAGIGVKATKGTEAIVNDRPNQRKRDATLYLYEPGVDATGDFSGAKTINNGSGKIAQPKAIEYDDNGKFVAANFNLGQTFTAGQYQIFVWTPGYLRKRIPNIQTLNAGTNTINQVVTLALGDADNNNHLDTLDFREYRSCLNQQTTACLKADFNDDGYIDNDDKHSGKEGNNKPSFLDYNLFVSEFSLINGD